ncbi:CD44 antigen isoform X9 [Panthera onca]|uniref:CD44 antigen isoform X12 n=1 Tax=Panthera leo TaxID=9689 RepID=UPI001C6953D9|nr:CD44 antigen isoform X12 [Panthera leo]XP_060462327.1 CD44 antigen isoform X10 [Panthera onca]
MDKFWWRLAWGLCLSQLSLAQIDLNITCRYAGVFHVEKNGRYSISKTEAADLCKAFNSTLPTIAEMEAALSIGFETCRYGFIEGHVVIPRIHPNSICAANNTGVYILTSNTSQYDTYCFNASAPPGEDCTSVTHLPNAFEGPITITIVNRDGTRYTQTGEYRTNPEDIYPSNPTDDDVSSGSSSERSTSGGYSIFHTHLPTAYPTQDQDSPGVSDNPENPPITISTTPRLFNHPKQNQDRTQWSPGESNPGVLLQTTARMTDVDRSSTIANGESWTREPHSPLIHHERHDEEETQHSTSPTPAHDSHPDQRMTTQSQEDSSWTYFFDPISHPMGRGHQTERWMDTDSSHSTTLQPSADPNTHSVEESDRTGPLSVTTQQSKTQSFSTSHGDWEEDKDHPVTSTPTSSSKDDRTDGKGGRRSGRLPEDSATSVESYTSQSPATKELRTLIPVTPAKTGVPEVTEVNIVGDSDSNVDRFFSEDQDSPVHPSGRSHTTHGSESAGHTSGSQEGGANTTSGPTRKPQIPEWLIILASLLALALILAVCIAVNSRRRCGQKKKLVINNGNGAVEERKASGLNGEASKSQEMVHLVNKESSVTSDQYMTADETRNLQNVDMKIGV